MRSKIVAKFGEGGGCSNLYADFAADRTLLAVQFENQKRVASGQSPAAGAFAGRGKRERIRNFQRAR